MPVLLRTIAVLLASLVPFAGSAQQQQPVVVELFTSQGCNSCPPADAYLAELSTRADVLPLALHVDYWDRLGWADTFASHEFTERQYAYAHAFKNRSVWTPQFVVQGQHYSRGDFSNAIDKHIAGMRSVRPRIDLTLREQGGMLQIRARPLETGLPAATVVIVNFSPAEEVSIKRGENAGRTITYPNVVTSWRVVGRLKGGGEVTFDVPNGPGLPVAVIVQEPGPGPILAAQVLR